MSRFLIPLHRMHSIARPSAYLLTMPYWFASQTACAASFGARDGTAYSDMTWEADRLLLDVRIAALWVMWRHRWRPALRRVCLSLFSACLFVCVSDCPCGNGVGVCDACDACVCVSLSIIFSNIRLTKFHIFLHLFTSPLIFSTCLLSLRPATLRGSAVSRSRRCSCCNRSTMRASCTCPRRPPRPHGASDSRVQCRPDAVNHCSDNSYSFAAFHEFALLTYQVIVGSSIWRYFSCV